MENTLGLTPTSFSNRSEKSSSNGPPESSSQSAPGMLESTILWKFNFLLTVIAQPYPSAPRGPLIPVCARAFTQKNLVHYTPRAFGPIMSGLPWKAGTRRGESSRARAKAKSCGGAFFQTRNSGASTGRKLVRRRELDRFMQRPIERAVHGIHAVDALDFVL